MRIPFTLAVLSFFFAPPPPGWGCPFLVLLFAFSFLFFFSSVPPLQAPLLSPTFCSFRPWLPLALVLCVFFSPPPLPTPLCLLPCAPVISGFLWFAAFDVLSVGAVQFPCTPPLLILFFLLWLPVVFVLGLGSFGLLFVFPRPNPLFPCFFLLFATFCSSSPSPPNVLILGGSILISLIRCLDLLYITFVWTSFCVVQNQQGFSKTNTRNKHSLVDLHEWHGLRGEVEYLPSRLVDTLRSEHPSLRQYTRYASDRWDSEVRLDYIFASPCLVSHFSLLDASVLTDYTISDHHHVVAVLQCPSPILLSQPPLPPCIFWKIPSDEKQQFSKGVQLISDWCRDLQDAPARALIGGDHRRH